MRNLILALSAVSLAMPVSMALPAGKAEARRHYYHGSSYRHRRVCRHSSGTTGLVAGGVGGGLIGSALGGGAVGTILGAGGGALLGRHLDKKHDEAQNRRNGC